MTHDTIKRIFHLVKFPIMFALLGGFFLFLTTYPLAVLEEKASPSISSENQVEGSTELLFKAEDLGWPLDSYDVRRNDFKPFETEPFAGISASATARSNPVINLKTGRRRRDDILAASQSLYIYPDKQTAVMIFDKFDAWGYPLGAYQPKSVQFEPRVDNASWTCWQMGDSQSRNCNFSMQHGQYLTMGNMIVDGQIITLADLELFLNLTQDRLVERVAKES